MESKPVGPRAIKLPPLNAVGAQAHRGTWLTALVVVLCASFLDVAGTASAAPALDVHESRPLAFEANRGQAAAHVRFVARGAGYTAFLTSTETVLRLGSHHTVHLKPIGAVPAAQVLGEEQLPGVVNYVLQGPSTAAIRTPTYGRVRYAGIYPGIDLVYYGHPSQLEYDFIVAP